MIINPSTNTLLRSLHWPSPDSVGLLERVSLAIGPWPALSSGAEAQVYFPEQGLIALSAPGAAHQRVRLALLGCQSCWVPGYWSASGMQAHVLVAGHAWRMPWSVLESEPQRWGPLLLQAAAASQQLVRQMAQTTFCAQHHSATERLASWLLIAMAQAGTSAMHLPLDALREWMRLPESELSLATHHLVAHGGMVLEGVPGDQRVCGLSPDKLTALACACHLHAKDSATLMPSTPADKMPPA